MSYTPPIGIPAPPFGIDETYRMYDDADLRAASGLTYQESAGGGYFTHYVDSTDPNATNSSNPYGNIAKPRTTIPYPLAAGSIVEVHNAGEFSSYYNITCNGTEDLPVFIRGVGDPYFESGGIIKGQYAIIEGLTLHTTSFQIRTHDGSVAHHISIRDCEIYGDGVIGSPAGFTIASYDTQVFHDIVIYNNHVHHGGDSETLTENDNHGVNIGSYVQNLWILNNHIHHMGGDSVQAGHGANWTSHHIYIGLNVLHDDRENAVDLKSVTDIVVSQNTMYGYNLLYHEDLTPDGTGSGTICVPHYSGSGIGTKRAWFIFNTMYSAQYAFSAASETDDIYYIGNIIYDIVDYAFMNWTHNSLYYIGNFMHNVGGGIDDTDTGDVDICKILNNIFSTLTAGTHITLETTDYRNGATVLNNLYSTTFSGNKQGTGSYTGDPLFADPDNGDFTLDVDSPFFDLSISQDVYDVCDDFLEQFDISIEDDVIGFLTGGQIPENPEPEPEPEPQASGNTSIILIEKRYTAIKPPFGTLPQRGNRLFDSLLSYWLINEGSGNIIRDCVRGWQGAIQSGVSWVAGPKGPCLYCSSYQQMINFGDYTPIEGISEFTILITAKSNEAANASGSDFILHKSGTGNDTFNLYWNQSDYFRFDVPDNSNPGTDTTYKADTPAITNMDSFHQVGGCFGVDGILECFIDAYAKSGVGTVARSGLTLNTSLDMACSWNGWIDNIMIFNRKLSRAEIAFLYSEPYWIFNSKIYIPSGMPASEEEPGPDPYEPPPELEPVHGIVYSGKSFQIVENKMYVLNS